MELPEIKWSSRRQSGAPGDKVELPEKSGASGESGAPGEKWSSWRKVELLETLWSSWRSADDGDEAYLTCCDDQVWWSRGAAEASSGSTTLATSMASVGY